MHLFRQPKTPVGRAGAALFALGAVAATAWALAPALSAQPYLPQARDFEQRLPQLERVDSNGLRALAGESEAHDDHPGEGPVTFRSPVIKAPARFDAAGVAGKLRPLELRGRETGGEWGEWLEVANGDPAWFGGADELQLRARGWRPRGWLHYVNVSGDSTPAEGALTKVREAVNGAVVSVASVFASEVAGADVPRPEVVSRAAWGANRNRGGCEPRRKASYGSVRAAAVHHTVSQNKYSRADAPGMVLAICRYHRNGNGWDDIGYQALVDRFGNIYAGRAGGLGRAVIGAHAEGVNAQTTGVAVIGTHTKRDPTKSTIRGVSRWLAWKLERHNRPAEGRAILRSAGGSTARYPKGRRFRVPRIFGHRQTNLTACPGDALFRQTRRKVRRRVARIIERNSGGDSGTGGARSG